jgi:hypothetical protein
MSKPWTPADIEVLRELAANRDYAYDIGLPAFGRIKNVGGRIHELRADGWDIKTDVRNAVRCRFSEPAVPKTVAMKL